MKSLDKNIVLNSTLKYNKISRVLKLKNGYKSLQVIFPISYRFKDAQINDFDIWNF